MIRFMLRRMVGLGLMLIVLLGLLLTTSTTSLAQPATPSGWVDLGTGLQGTIYTFAVTPDGTLYAGGWFEPGDEAKNHIARWTGSGWERMDNGVTDPEWELDWVNALAVGNDGSLYVGGHFSQAGMVQTTNIALWTSRGWAAMAPGPHIIDEAINAIAVGKNGTLYVGGNFTQVGHVSASYIARWTGTQWEEVGGGLAEPVTSLLLTDDGLLHVGTETGIYDWNGTTWSQPSGAATMNIRMMVEPNTGARGNQAYYAAGIFSSAGAVPANNIARWTGTEWQAIGSGLNGEVADMVVGPDGSIYVSGNFSLAGGVPVNNIARWTGTRWEAVGMANDPWTALVIGADGMLYTTHGVELPNQLGYTFLRRWEP